MKVRREIWALSTALLLSATAAFAQNQLPDPRNVNPDAPLPPVTTTAPSDQPPPADTPPADTNERPPVPAARGLSPAYEPADADPAQAVPDTHTLAGVEPIGIGSMGVQHDLFDPSATLSMLADSRGFKSNGQTGLAYSQIISGNLFYTHLWGHNQFTSTYSGGETIEDNATQFSGGFHNLVVQQELVEGRWTFHLLDNFTYSPGAAFGGGGMGGPALINEFAPSFGSTLDTLGETFVPSETIETGFARRYRNDAVGEAEYAFSRRSAFTVSASYGVLNFINSGYISSREDAVQAGYDYSLDPKNSVALLANYGTIHYVGGMTSTQDYSAAVAYGRKITGRLGFEVAVGPERVRATGTLNGDFQFWMTSVRSALTYQRRRTGYTASYIRGLANGAGVFFGARANTVVFTATHQFTHVWTMALNSGYSFNNAIVPAGATATTFNHWYVGATASRQLNPHMRIDFSYGLQKQDAPTFCPVLNCGVVGYDHTFGVTANWHLHPLQE